MDCEKVMKVLIDRALGDDFRNEPPGAGDHLAACAACRKEHRDLLEMRNLLRTHLPDRPEREIDDRIAVMVKGYEAGMAVTRPAAPDRRDWSPVLQAVAMLVVGFGVGLALGILRGPEPTQELQVEIRELRHDLVATMLKLDSTTDRLRAVSSIRPGELDPVTRDALIDALNRDTSANVRLAALDALAHHLQDPAVISGLRGSLERDQPALIRESIVEILNAVEGT